VPLLAVHVHVKVTPESVEPFKAATLENARHSIDEAGIARFDVLQRPDEPTEFLLVEVYRNPEAMAAHKDTRHYQVWRDAVAPMMARPRTSVKYTNVFPADHAWG
jgi:quinol monooxygenase YgiN